MSLLKCHGFLFDMDGVLVDSRAVVDRCWRRWAARHDMDPEPIIAVATAGLVIDLIYPLLDPRIRHR